MVSLVLFLLRMLDSQVKEQSILIQLKQDGGVWTGLNPSGLMNFHTASLCLSCLYDSIQVAFYCRLIRCSSACVEGVAGVVWIASMPWHTEICQWDANHQSTLESSWYISSTLPNGFEKLFAPQFRAVIHVLFKYLRSYSITYLEITSNE